MFFCRYQPEENSYHAKFARDDMEVVLRADMGDEKPCNAIYLLYI